MSSSSSSSTCLLASGISSWDSQCPQHGRYQSSYPCHILCCHGVAIPIHRSLIVSLHLLYIIKPDPLYEVLTQGRGPGSFFGILKTALVIFELSQGVWIIFENFENYFGTFRESPEQSETL